MKYRHTPYSPYYMPTKSYGLPIMHKHVGEIIQMPDGEKIYFSDRTVSIHWYRIGQGYAISVDILDLLKREGVKKIRIREHGRQDGVIAIWETYVSDYEFIEPFQQKGYDLQKIIPLRRWKRIGLNL